MVARRPIPIWATILVVGLVFTNGCGDDDAEEVRTLTVEYKDVQGKEHVQTIFVNGFERTETNDEAFVVEEIDWDGIDALVVDLTDAEMPCRGAAFDEDTELVNLGQALGESVNVEVGGEPAVVHLVGCRSAQISAA